MFDEGTVVAWEVSAMWFDPCEVRVGDSVERSFGHDATGRIRLVVNESELSLSMVEDLARMVAAVPGEARGENGERLKAVPLVEPSQIDEDGVIWRPTEGLRVVHVAEDQVRLFVEGGEARDGCGVTELSDGAVWEVLRALLSVMAWDSRMAAAMERAARRFRVETGQRILETTEFGGLSSTKVGVYGATPMPCYVAIEGDEVRHGDCQVGCGVDLAMKGWQLTATARHELLQWLVGIDGVVPDGVTDEGGRVLVPFLEAEWEERETRWRISNALALVHGEVDSVFFDCEHGSDDGVIFANLSSEEIWRLVRALASLAGWEVELASCFDEAACTQRRARALQVRARRT